VGQRVGVAVHRGLALLHALQQRRLRLGRRAVDLVADDDVGEQRARPELELVRLAAEDVDAGQVAREQVRRELDAPDGAVDAACECLRQGRLADAGNVFEQEVPLGEQDADSDAHELAAPCDDPLDRRTDPVAGPDELV
jgi:hypothetical protein